MSVSINPGATALTVIWRAASSLAQDLVRPSRPGLGGAVVGLSGVAHLAHDGRDVHDAAVTGLGHDLGGFAGADEGTAQVDGDDAVEVIVLHADQEAVLGDAGIVDQHGQVDLAFDMFGKKGSHGFAVAHVEGQGQGTAAGASISATVLSASSGRAHVGEDDLIAVTGQGQGNGATVPREPPVTSAVGVVESRLLMMLPQWIL